MFKEGLRASARENATAYGFSIMITATLAVSTALDGSPGVWEVFFFAFAGAVAFTLILGLSTSGLKEAASDAVRTEILIVAASVNVLSVLAAVGIGALIAWIGHGWAVWLTAPAAASATYVLVNGFEYALAEEEKS